MIFRIIRDSLTPELTIADCCCVLKVSVNGCDRRHRHLEGKRRKWLAELVEQVRVVHAASRRTHGSSRATRAAHSRRHA